MSSQSAGVSVAEICHYCEKELGGRSKRVPDRHSAAGDLAEVCLICALISDIGVFWECLESDEDQDAQVEAALEEVRSHLKDRHQQELSAAVVIPVSSGEEAPDRVRPRPSRAANLDGPGPSSGRRSENESPPRTRRRTR